MILTNKEIMEDIYLHLKGLKIKKDFRLHLTIMYIYWKEPTDFSSRCCDAYAKYIDFLNESRMK